MKSEQQLLKTFLQIWLIQAAFYLLLTIFLFLGSLLLRVPFAPG